MSEVKKTLSVRDAITEQCVKWYRKYGKNFDDSVWKVIRLVKGHHGIGKLEADEVEAAARYAKLVALKHN